MSDWGTQARRAAAREFGARHYRWYAAGNILGPLAPVLGALVILGGLGLGAWWVAEHIHPAYVLTAGLVLGAVVVGIWLARQFSLNARTYSHSSGNMLLYLIPVAVVAGIVTAWMS